MFFLTRLDRKLVFISHVRCLGDENIRSSEPNVKETYESFRRIKFHIFFLLLIWNLGSGAAIKMCSQKRCFVKLISFIGDWTNVDLIELL